MKLFFSAVLGIAFISFTSGLSPAAAQPGVTERVSVASSGAEADNTSEMPAISADGRFVAFVSLASNLVPNDTNDPPSCTRSGKGRRGGTLSCDLGALAAGATASVTIVVEPERNGAPTNTATVRAAQPDSNLANNSATETTTVF
jgi:hypothetical protein